VPPPWRWSRRSVDSPRSWPIAHLDDSAPRYPKVGATLERRTMLSRAIDERSKH
jgi:hypothetical protein